LKYFTLPQMEIMTPANPVQNSTFNVS